MAIERPMPHRRDDWTAVVPSPVCDVMTAPVAAQLDELRAMVENLEKGTSALFSRLQPALRKEPEDTKNRAQPPAHGTSDITLAMSGLCYRVQDQHALIMTIIDRLEI